MAIKEQHGQNGSSRPMPVDPLQESCRHDRLVGLVVNASASKAADPGFDSRLRRWFRVESHQ